jgi:uncharacterized protein (TIGR03437 family)
MQPTHLFSNKRKALATAILCLAACPRSGPAQVAPPTILRIEVANTVRYVDDTEDVTKLATGTDVTGANLGKNFQKAVFIADIVAVNGQPAKGTVIQNGRTVILRPAPTPGQGIADITRDGIIEWAYEILNADGTPVGTIIALGLGANVNGTAPPGAPLEATQGNSVIVGGTGAFLGARGYVGANTSVTVVARSASVTEDPSNRIKNGGGKTVFVLEVIPMSRPEIKSTGNGPAVIHSSDSSLVTANNPAKAGELLSLFATGLGPVRAQIDPGQPFPADPLAAVNSPVDVTVNGTSAEVLAAVGYPGSVDGYQVNFRVPANAGHGTAQLQLSAAWITSNAVGIPVQ